jgi:CxxC motif-containing protein (DUF1111 family)
MFDAHTIKGLMAAAAVAGLTFVSATDMARPNPGDARTDTGKAAFSHPVARLKADHQRDFSFGGRLFRTQWVAAPSALPSFDGLGPLFNKVACDSCHEENGRGRPALEKDGRLSAMLIRLSVPDPSRPNGAAPHPVYGDQLSDAATAGFAPEAKVRVSYETIGGTYGDGERFELLKPAYVISGPSHGPLAEDIMLSGRTAPQMIGLGLLEGVADEDLLSMSDPDDRNSDGISGRPNHVPDPEAGTLLLGRFGWKAGAAGLAGQNALAAFGDIGLTNALHRHENCADVLPGCGPGNAELDLSEDFLAKLTLFTRLIAVPAQRSEDDPQVMRGAALFTSLGCGKCHVPTLRTGPDTVLPELANQTFHPFTDLLLHDMGEALADNRPDFEATGSEWRTPPLWGLGLVETVNGHNRLLHDGRARGFAEAILWHGGEGEASKEAFRNAVKEERDALVRFLGSL